MNRVIKCIICGSQCPLEDALNAAICPECCEDIGLDDDYEEFGEDMS